MFTGIIKKTSKVERVQVTRGGMILGVCNVLGKVKVGESIAVNGVCSTVKKSEKSLLFEYMPETLKLTSLSNLKKGDILNIEQSMQVGDRIGGHIVLGHVDGRDAIFSVRKEGNSKVFEIKFPKKFKKFLVYKGSVAVEGISLTVAKVLRQSFLVKITPYTLEHTNLKFKKKGDLVNLEFDIHAKYAYANQK